MISITDPIQPAMAYTRRILFRPFSWQKWFLLGFSAFLAQLGEGGTFNLQGNPFDRTTLKDVDMTPIREWVLAHLAFVIALGVVLFLAIMALAILFQWLGSRGSFMFLDGIVQDRPGVVEPWVRFQRPANQVFRFRLMLLLTSLGLLLVSGGAGLLVALPDLQARSFGPSALAGILLGVGVLLVGLLALGAIGLLLEDFVIPLMYRSGLDLAVAWGVLRKELLPGHGWHFLGFYVMKGLLWIPATLLLVVGICCTCCLAALPYLSSVAFLPVFVFFRCYALEFLGQFGEAWHLLEVPSEAGQAAEASPEGQF